MSTLLNAIRAPYKSLRDFRPGGARILSIIWDPARPDPSTGGTVPPPRRRDVDTLMKDVFKYFRENSGKQIRFERSTRGPYPAAFPWAHYDRTDGHVDSSGAFVPSDDDADGWIAQHHQKYAEAITAAAADGFDFARYAHEGKINPDQLAIVIVVPGTGGARGFVRPALVRDAPVPQALKVQGVEIGNIVELYVTNPLLTNDTRGGLAHELAHVFLGHTDMYFGFPNGLRAGSYSLMDNDGQFAHLDPFAKLKLGWITPKLYTRPRRHTLGAVETTREVLVLASGSRGSDEYFILENRCNSVESFDRVLPDSGLAIWHVIEKPEIYRNLGIPPNGTADDWAKVDRDDWGRRGIRLIRPHQPPDDTMALWRPPSFTTADLHWSDGTPAFRVYGISPPGPQMSFRVTHAVT